MNECNSTYLLQSTRHEMNIQRKIHKHTTKTAADTETDTIQLNLMSFFRWNCNVQAYERAFYIKCRVTVVIE